MKDLTLKQIAEELSISPGTVKTLICTGQLAGYNAAPHGSPYAAWRVTRSDLDNFKKQRTAKREPVRRRRRPLPKVKKFF